MSALPNVWRGQRWPLGWDSSRAMLLANNGCAECAGLGVRLGRSQVVICNCVWREIFRQCYGSYKNNRAAQQAARTSVAIENLTRGTSGRRLWRWSRPAEEYQADFELIARRTLDPAHHDVFRLHFIAGLEWKQCCRMLRMDRGSFFHAVYRVERKLGEAFSCTLPYPLFPVSRYLGQTVSVGPAMAALNSRSMGSFVSG